MPGHKLTAAERTYYEKRGGAVCISCGRPGTPYGATEGGICLCEPCIARAAIDHQKHKRALLLARARSQREDTNALRISRELLKDSMLLAPGVVGLIEETPESLTILTIYAVRMGSGEVGNYLDYLPRDKYILVPNVISSRLAGMLERRLFTLRPATDNDWERHPL